MSPQKIRRIFSLKLFSKMQMFLCKVHFYTFAFGKQMASKLFFFLRNDAPEECKPLNALLQNFKTWLYSNRGPTISMAFMTSVLTLVGDSCFRHSSAKSHCKTAATIVRLARKDPRDQKMESFSNPKVPTDS